MVLAVLLTFGAPSFSSLLERSRANRLQTELFNFYIYARSEAAMCNQELYLHFVGLDEGVATTQNWCLLLSEDVTVTSCSDEAIQILQGSSFSGIHVERLINRPYLTLDSVRGRAELNSLNTEGYASLLSYYSKLGQSIAFKAHTTGRPQLCGIGGEWYGIG